jgi:hypothetical protein
MSITGIIKESNIFGPALELRRTISSTLGSSAIHIHDEITNRGNTAAPHMILYHCNFGWPLADEGAQLIWKGNMTTREGKEFPNPEAFKVCRDAIPEHNGNGEQVAIIDIEADEKGQCIAGLHNPKIHLGIAMKFSKLELPWLTNWQHFGKGEYVTGIEPGSHPPIGQAKARENNTLIFIEPGETRTYNLTIEITT